MDLGANLGPSGSWKWFWEPCGLHLYYFSMIFEVPNLHFVMNVSSEMRIFENFLHFHGNVAKSFFLQSFFMVWRVHPAC